MPSTSRTLVREEAQTMAEYTVVLALITLAIVSSYALLAGSIAAHVRTRGGCLFLK